MDRAAKQIGEIEKTMILDTSKYVGPCVCGRVHELRTKLVVCERGALRDFDAYMSRCGLDGFRIVIYDTNTFGLPTLTHPDADQEIVLNADGLHSEKGLIEDMMARFSRKPDYIVAVGGGTIMDFGRYSAFKLGVPFVAVPTLVSSDGFTANICSIIIDGQKKSIPMLAPDAVVCDLDVVSGAPMFLTISGVQDILSKYISLADWKIANLVTGEYFCPMVYSMAEEALGIMAACAEELRKGLPPDHEKMAYAQMLSGLTMQILSHSRAASGAEHLIAHLVEMKPRGFENAHGLHGECVGVGTVMCAGEYHRLAKMEKLATRPFEPLPEAWLRERFGPMTEGLLLENEHDVLETVDEAGFRNCWPEIRAVIASIPEADELRELYRSLGAKYRLSDLGVDEGLGSEALKMSAAIRNRLTLCRLERMIVE